MGGKGKWQGRRSQGHAWGVGIYFVQQPVVNGMYLGRFWFEEHKLAVWYRGYIGLLAHGIRLCVLLLV